MTTMAMIPSEMGGGGYRPPVYQSDWEAGGRLPLTPKQRYIAERRLEDLQYLVSQGITFGGPDLQGYAWDAMQRYPQLFPWVQQPAGNHFLGGGGYGGANNGYRLS
jgi:hypothetical protein